VIRTVIASRIRLYRDGLAAELERIPDLVVVGTAASVSEAVEQALVLQPSIVVLDLTLPGALQGVREVVDAGDDIRVVVLGVRRDERLDYTEHGAAGSVSREESLEELVETIRAADRGELRCTPRFARVLADRLSSLAPASAVRERFGALTMRESGVMRLLQDGLTNKEIAHRLHISVPTVKNHVHNVLHKLEVRTRSQAAALSRELGWDG